MFRTEAITEINERSLKEDCRLLSAYTLSTGTRIWIISEAVRTST